jgi:hypothetical protein
MPSQRTFPCSCSLLLDIHHRIFFEAVCLKFQEQVYSGTDLKEL